MEEFVIIIEDGSERKLCYRSKQPFLGKLAEAVDLADDLKSANPQFEYKIMRVVEYATAGKRLSPKVRFDKLVKKEVKAIAFEKASRKPLSGIKPRKAKIYDPYSTKERAASLTTERRAIQRVLRKK